MPTKRPVKPFNWKRTLVILAIADIVALAVFLVGKMTENKILAEVGFGALAVLMIWNLAVVIYGPFFSRPNAKKKPPATQS